MSVDSLREAGPAGRVDQAHELHQGPDVIGQHVDQDRAVVGHPPYRLDDLRGVLQGTPFCADENRLFVEVEGDPLVSEQDAFLVLPQLLSVQVGRISEPVREAPGHLGGVSDQDQRHPGDDVADRPDFIPAQVHDVGGHHRGGVVDVHVRVIAQDACAARGQAVIDHPVVAALAHPPLGPAKGTPEAVRHHREPLGNLLSRRLVRGDVGEEILYIGAPCAQACCSVEPDRGGRLEDVGRPHGLKSHEVVEAVAQEDAAQKDEHLQLALEALEEDLCLCQGDHVPRLPGGRPVGRVDAIELEGPNRTVPFRLHVLYVRVHAVAVGADQGQALRKFLFQVGKVGLCQTAKADDALRDVIFQKGLAVHLGLGSIDEAAKMIHVEDTVPGHLVPLDEDHVFSILSVDVGDAPLVAVHVHRLAEGLDRRGRSGGFLHVVIIRTPHHEGQRQEKQCGTSLFLHRVCLLP